MDVIHLTPAQVAAGVQDRFSRDWWTVERHADGGCDLVPCRTDAAVAAAVLGTVLAALSGDDAWMDAAWEV